MGEDVSIKFKPHCETHDALQEIIVTTSNNIAWFKKLGSWTVGLLGLLITITFPTVVAFFVYTARMETRLTVLEQIVTHHIIEVERKQVNGR